jgi:hypothetical protein
VAKKKFNFPKSLLKQLNEFSSGGYVLFNFNENNDPQVISKFDNQMNAMALLYYINTWSQSIDQLNLDATTDAILQENGEDREGDDTFSDIEDEDEQ